MSSTAAIERLPRLQSSIPATDASSLTVEVHHDLEWARDEAARLDALIAARPHVGVFLSRAWLSGYFAEPPAGVRLSVLLFRQHGVLQGLLPLAIGGGMSTHLKLVGGGMGSDRVDLLTASGYETACADRFVQWLGETFTRGGFTLELRDVPAESALWGALGRVSAAGTPPIVVQPIEMHTLPYLDLGGARPDGNDSTLPDAAARSLEKHRRWLHRRGHIAIEILDNVRDASQALDDLGGFLHSRWHASGSHSALDDSRVLRFHRHVVPLLMREGRLRMIRVSADMRPIAVYYGLMVDCRLSTPPHGSWWGYYLAGFDREWAGRIHLGRIVLATAVDLARLAGAAEFDFLKGVEPVKYLWPVGERRTVDADVYSRAPGAQFIRAARATREAVAALVKGARAVLR